MDTHTLTLTDFLLARIGEDEHAAAVDEPWRLTDDNNEPKEDAGENRLLDWGSEMIMSVTRSRWLAECETKRRVVELADEVNAMDERLDTELATSRRDLAAYPYVGDLILRALALPYADHPDYREEWRP